MIQTGPWSLKLTFPRQVYCPVCGLRMPPAAAVLAEDLLICGMCCRTAPRSVTQAIALHRSHKAAELWGCSHGVIAYLSRLDMERPARVWMQILGRWPGDDQPCDYAEHERA